MAYTYSCLHTHSTFCDGHDDIETFCSRAYKKGLVSLGFSSHAPIYRKTGFRSDWHLPEERLEEYMDAVRAARRRWEGRIQVFLGLEVDYIPGLMGPGDRDIQNLGLDYIIGSVHYVLPPRGGEPFTVDDTPEILAQGIREGFAGDVSALVETYWDTVEAMILDQGFDILGHGDLIKKNNAQGQWFSPEETGYVRRLAGIARILGERAMVVEVNTGGLNRYKIPETYPSLGMLKLLREQQVSVIITADAHRAEHLDGHYEEARETLLRAGYTQTVLFQGRKAGHPVWIGEPL